MSLFGSLYQDGCVFCGIVRDSRNDKGMVLAKLPDSVVFVPLNPVAKDGHLLVAPTRHVRDAVENPNVLAHTMADAVRYICRMGWVDLGMMINVGPEAGQTVDHLHVHLVRWAPEYDLPLPWTGQKRWQRLAVYLTGGRRGCGFCRIVTTARDERIVWGGKHSVIVRPYDPVTDDHLLLIPKVHARGGIVDWVTMVLVMYDLCEYNRLHPIGPFNLVIDIRRSTRRGWHFVIHIIPRQGGVHVRMPWSDQLGI